MITKPGDIEILQANLEPDTGKSSDLTLAIKFGNPSTRATILMRHAQFMPNTRANIHGHVLASGFQACGDGKSIKI
ncbi:hypothetical protein [Bradyrhizobium sp.]|uniref:hypothetical protein n=1 Tax=Bradyrhizobium sp. TaxID=376 RepID=UPI003C47A086